MNHHRWPPRIRPRIESIAADEAEAFRLGHCDGLVDKWGRSQTKAMRELERLRWAYDRGFKAGEEERR